MPVLKTKKVRGFLKGATIKAEALTVAEHGNGEWRSPAPGKTQTTASRQAKPSVRQRSVARRSGRTV